MTRESVVSTCNDGWEHRCSGSLKFQLYTAFLSFWSSTLAVSHWISSTFKWIRAHQGLGWESTLGTIILVKKGPVSLWKSGIYISDNKAWVQGTCEGEKTCFCLFLYLISLWGKNMPYFVTEEPSYDVDSLEAHIDFRLSRCTSHKSRSRIWFVPPRPKLHLWRASWSKVTNIKIPGKRRSARVEGDLAICFGFTRPRHMDYTCPNHLLV